MNYLQSSDWKLLIEKGLSGDLLKEINLFLADEYSDQKIYPPRENIFHALNLTPFNKVKVVLIGQDPYHGPDQAHGLSFSVPDNVKIPPSLRNIFRELHDDLDLPLPLSGNLTAWAEQGVLLLNSTLTVRAGKAGSHMNSKWNQMTHFFIEQLSCEREHLVFLLWGNHAIKMEHLIDSSRHCIIKSVHPSPLSAYRGFLGSRPFSRVNDYLVQCGVEPVNWMLQ